MTASAARAHVARVEPRQVKAMLRDGGELALLDVREEGVFARSHLLFATPLPLSRLELDLAALVPRRSTRIVLLDDADGLADRAAALMTRFGYRDLAVLAGGVAAWRDAGYELFSGVHVPSKAFGEVVEHEAGTPNLSASELKAKLDAGEKLVILDSRPMDEYRVMSIPGGIDCPGAELVRFVHDVPPTPEGLAKARSAAKRLAARAGVRIVDRGMLDKLRAEAESRSLYLLDVRSPEEYAAGHLPGSRSAPGGQLVQATDAYVGTLNARLVLVDDDGIRSLMTASWLLQLGWNEVYAMPNALWDSKLEAGAELRPILSVRDRRPDLVSAEDLRRSIDSGGVLVLDLGTSLQFRDGHIPGARWAIRSRLAAILSSLPVAREVVVTSGDGRVAELGAGDLAELIEIPVRVLDGGTAAWRAAGYPTASGTEHMLCPLEDVWYRPYDRAQDREAAMKEYLSWEVDLVRQVERDGDARFRVLT